jgi:hypothetical protein
LYQVMMTCLSSVLVDVIDWYGRIIWFFVLASATNPIQHMLSYHINFNYPGSINVHFELDLCLII